MNIDQRTSKRSKVGLIAVLVLIALSLQADSPTEREFLTQVSQEIAQLDSLIKRAERARNPNERLQFRYDWLRKDLQSVREGIESYISEYHLTPRSFPALKGEYSQ